MAYDLNEQHMANWKARRDQESRDLASAPTPEPTGKSISEDGNCLVCNGQLVVIEHQPHLARDWCWCRFCGNTMPAALGAKTRGV